MRDETSLARLVSTRFSKKPTFQKLDEKQVRKVPGINLWPPQACEYPHKHRERERVRGSVC